MRVVHYEHELALRTHSGYSTPLWLASKWSEVSFLVCVMETCCKEICNLTVQFSPKKIALAQRCDNSNIAS